MYNVKTDQFEGPFPLLLELIEKEELDITKLSLAKVADDYLEFIEQNHGVSLANLSEFLLVASQLILLKSKALLPLFEFTKEEEEEIEDLEQRLREYQRFKKAAVTLSDNYYKREICYAKGEEDLSLIVFAPPKIGALDLKKLYVKVLDQIPQKEEMAQQVMQEVISLEDKIHHLRRSLEKRITMAFHETIKDAKDKIDVIVTFLAMLEMVKQKVVHVSQNDLFGEITIKKYSESLSVSE